MSASSSTGVLAALIALVLATACGGDGDGGGDADGASQMSRCGAAVSEESVAGARDLITFGAQAGDGGYGLYSMQPDGSDLRQLTDEAGYVFFPQWSPTGDRLAYIVGEEGSEEPGALRVYDFALRLATTVSERALPSLDGPAAAWSPDGGRLAFVEASGDGRLRVFDLEDGAFVELPDVSASEPAWSPTGDELAFISSDSSGEETDLYLLDLDDGEPRPLLERPGLEGNPRWSPNGECLALWGAPADQPEERELLVVNREGSLTELGPGSDAAWSPDGSQLAYSAPAPEEAANLDLFLTTLEGDSPQRLIEAETVTLESWPDWSPDGEQVAYISRADPQTAFLCITRLEPRGSDCPDVGDLMPGPPAWQ